MIQICLLLQNEIHIKVGILNRNSGRYGKRKVKYCDHMTTNSYNLMNNFYVEKAVTFQITSIVRNGNFMPSRLKLKQKKNEIISLCKADNLKNNL